MHRDCSCEAATRLQRVRLDGHAVPVLDEVLEGGQDLHRRVGGAELRELGLDLLEVPALLGEPEPDVVHLPRVLGEPEFKPQPEVIRAIVLEGSPCLPRGR